MKLDPRFYRSLRERGMSMSKLAAQANVSRCHVSAALLGKPGRGGTNRKRLIKYLTAEEIQILSSTWNNFTRVTFNQQQIERKKNNE